MDLEKLWADNKKTIVTTVLVVVVGMLVIKFFDVLFLGAIVIALGVAAVLGWNHFTKKYGGPEAALKAAMKAIWAPEK
jgi:hypothetical protein